MRSARLMRTEADTGLSAICFKKHMALQGAVKKAVLHATAIGVYRFCINGRRVGDHVLAPGYTSYQNRVTFQTYDVTDMLLQDNLMEMTVAPGWAVGHLGYAGGTGLYCDHVAAAAELEIEYADGRCDTVALDESWQVYTDKVTFADIYMGETIDMTHQPSLLGNAVADSVSFNIVSDNGAPITLQERICPRELIITPKGERVIDFGQNLTGTVSLSIKGNKGDRVVISFAEVLDSQGNFYTDNYRTAKSVVTFVLSGEQDLFLPEFSFQGFRYIRLDEYPFPEVNTDGFRSVVIHTKMKRTGDFLCGDPKINQLYHNVIWGQKSNYLDIPTDCPQRDERLGWTGDTQVFCRTAAINYDVRKFFEKWLTDLRLEQHENGAVYGTCPETAGMHRPRSRISAGWGDAATIVPWTLYELYGDKAILEDNFELMRRWVEYIHSAGTEEYLWLCGYHYGDWLAMDAGEDSYVGATSNDLVASAFFAYSTSLLVKAGKALGKDMSYYEDMHGRIVSAFREYFMENGMPKESFPLTEIIPAGKTSSIDKVRLGMTQTAIVLILHFGLCTEEERPALTQKLCQLIEDFGGRMSTGFLGTPYILHALSDNGRADVAYKLLFNEGNPSWLYSVNHGATTMWEHWNSLKEDGSFWSTDMNSFNHYAYGAVADWMYGAIAGIKVTEAGYKQVTVAPKPCERLGFIRCRIDTAAGRLESNWYYTAEDIRYEITVPEGTKASIVLPDGYTTVLGGGSYCFTTKK